MRVASASCSEWKLNLCCCGFSILALQLWVLTGTGTMGELRTVQQNVHLAMNANIKTVWSPAGKQHIVAVTINADATLGVNLDVAGDGFGGMDHAVMMQVVAAPQLSVGNGMLTIDDLGTVSGDVYWRVSPLLLLMV